MQRILQRTRARKRVFAGIAAVGLSHRTTRTRRTYPPCVKGWPSLVPALVPALLAVPFALAACGGEEPARTPSGVTTATPAARASATATPTGTAPPAAPTPAASRTAAPLPEGTPTEAEIALATLAGESAPVLAGAIEFLDGRCSDDREALGRHAEQTWRILNEQRNVRAPASAILARVIASLPVDGRTVACESLFASVVVELTR